MKRAYGHALIRAEKRVQGGPAGTHARDTRAGKHVTPALAHVSRAGKHVSTRVNPPVIWRRA